MPSAVIRAGRLGLVVLACGCAPVMRPTLTEKLPRGAVRVDLEELSECQRLRGDSRFADRGEALPVVEPSSDLPVELRRVVQAAGVDPLLVALTLGGSVEVKLDLVMRLSSLEIQVASLLFEAQCVGAQMDAVLRELDGHQRTREIGLTVSSILVGSVVSAAGGIWALRSPDVAGPEILLIGSGVASAGLGLAAFVPERRAVEFPHQRNLLGPIVRGEDPDELYPSFVFRMLLLPDPEGETLRDEILIDWQRILADAFPPGQRALAESVLYGTGGIYDEQLIEVHEQMFDVLESHLNAVNQELDLLYRYSARLVEVGLPADGP